MKSSSIHQEKKIDSKNLKIGLIVSNWHGAITYKIYQEAYNKLSNLGIQDLNIKKWEVPGSFELIYACDKICKTESLDSLIAIGVLIKGETMHFEYICQALSQGIKQINLNYDIPTIFGILTTNTLEQAKERAEGKKENKGKEWAMTAVEMANFRKSLKI